MISVSESQLRIITEAADLLSAEVRGTFLRRIVAELRERRDCHDSDIQRAVRAALLDQSGDLVEDNTGASRCVFPV
jgi:hypothetical protein